MENILNRPPSISEDTLQYDIYPPPQFSDRTAVTTFAVALQSFVDSTLSGFIWHRDSFELKVVEDPDGHGWKVEGRMRVGDSIDDEWCVVWLLREMSAKWDIVVSVYDSDGDFLLIEAADALPSWVTPTVAENRVWIYQSHLHLLPLSYISPPSSKRRRRRLPGAHESDDEDADGDDHDFINITDALKLVRDPAIDTVSPVGVERIVWQRIKGYPDTLSQHTHTAKVYLPVDIAKALSADPALVQRAVETFYTRDALQLRAAHKMTRFPPEPSIVRSVKMTRTAYAQLIGQKFYAPKIFGRWSEQEGSQQWRWKDIGMKITCGFEMLYQESKGRTGGSNETLDGINSSAEARKDSLRRDPDYIKYIQSLVTTGYFKGETETSQLWTELEEKAVNVYLQTRRGDDASRPSFAYLTNIAVLKAGELQPSDEAEEPDEWLNVDAENFDALLEKRLNVAEDKLHADVQAMDVDEPEDGRAAENRLAEAQAKKMQHLAKKVETFLEGKGDVEGATFEDEQSSGDEASEFSDEHFSDSDSDSDAEGNTRDDAARREAMENLVPGIDPSEYGKMPPAFHSQSQRVAPATVETEVIAAATGPSTTEPPRTKPVRAPILLRDKYDGVDSDDETDEEDGGVGDEEEEEDRPQVVGEVEVDMEEEEDEFLEFSRQALGISDEQWGDILRDRKSRGAFVPSHVVTESRPAQTGPTSSAQAKTSEIDAEPKPRTPVPGPRPHANPNLDSFEAVMQAMDAELARSRALRVPFQPPPASTPSTAEKGKGKAKATVEDEGEDEADIETTMDAELRAALERGDVDDEVGLDGEAGLDYNLIKNFLESFKNQGGLSGPVSNLAGRLQPGWGLPRDET
ncbi:hypothetical protein BV25DRAFT_1794079 [Artomyces pyxidatus]|uniref:Uncharacterized protein n=1 Tax=Artomyces pyxidatus TaxID=48021 RepID=A0ACB8TH84_9AGAM|nr:hypothetical protein BV25DRAFT_1794079 [Artomyces pyxidatus]